MYTDRAYLVKDRFQDKVAAPGSVATLYRGGREKDPDTVSTADPDSYPVTYGLKSIPECPPGLELLYQLKKVYLTKRIEMLENDTYGIYKAEIIDDNGNRIFVISNAAHYESDEVVYYGKHKQVKVQGKICYGVINYAGIQVFKVYGDPEKALRIGPDSSVWGEIQVIPGDVWDTLTRQCFRLWINNKNKPLDDAEVRVVVLKRDKAEDVEHQLPHKQVYLLRGKIVGGCCHQEHNILYRKSFDMKIYDMDPFAVEDPSKKGKRESGDTGPGEKNEKGKEPELEPIGRICSEELHEKLGYHLPMLEMPQTMTIYDKITLMGGFFMFNLKI